MNEEEALDRIEELKGFYSHLASFVAVNLFLFAINVVSSPGSWWFVYPLFGWGIGLAIHAFNIFGTNANWENRKLQELTGVSETREELQRLSERTDNLVTILSSVDWEKIDPELLQTKTNLETTRQSIASLKQERSPSRQAAVTREIEKLEEFVTSSRFDYYELAAVDSAAVETAAVDAAPVDAAAVDAAAVETAANKSGNTPTPDNTKPQ